MVVTMLTVFDNGIPGHEPDSVELDFIGVAHEDRGQGHATRALAAMCRIADDFGITMRLDADPAFGSDFRRLIRWYTRHGFRVTGLNGTVARMSRAPA